MKIKSDIQVGAFLQALDQSYDKLTGVKAFLAEPSIFQQLRNYYLDIKQVLSVFSEDKALASVYGSDLKFPKDLIEAIDFFANNPDQSTYAFKQEINNTSNPLVLYTAMRAYHEFKEDL